MLRQLRSGLRALAFIAGTLGLTGTASAQDCLGCNALIIPGATVAVPGYSITIEFGNPNINGEPYDQNGSCHEVSDICQQDTKCKMVVEYSYVVPAGRTAKLTGCYWVYDEVEEEWGWDCYVVDEDVEGSVSSLENIGHFNCGQNLKQKMTLGPASKTVTFWCNACYYGSGPQ